MEGSGGLGCSVYEAPPDPVANLQPKDAKDTPLLNYMKTRLGWFHVEMVMDSTWNVARYCIHLSWRYVYIYICYSQQGHHMHSAFQTLFFVWIWAMEAKNPGQLKEELAKKSEAWQQKTIKNCKPEHEPHQDSVSNLRWERTKKVAWKAQRYHDMKIYHSEISRNQKSFCGLKIESLSVNGVWSLCSTSMPVRWSPWTDWREAQMALCRVRAPQKRRVHTVGRIYDMNLTKVWHIKTFRGRSGSKRPAARHL